MKYLAMLLSAILLIVGRAAAQDAHASCIPVQISCDRRYGNAGWAFDQKTCMQLKADSEKIYRECTTAIEKLSKSKIEDADEVQKKIAATAELSKAIKSFTRQTRLSRSQA
jgi:hypothetical protein